VFRIIRLADFFLHRMKALVLLAVAAPRSVKPVSNVVVLTVLVLGAFIVWLMMSVPMVLSSGDKYDKLVVDAFGSVGQSTLTLIGSMTGGSGWGKEVAFLLFEGKMEQNAWRMVLLFTLLGFSCLLFLALNGLVSGIFLDQLEMAAQDEDDVRSMEARAETEELLEPLAQTFAVEGFYGEKPISWSEVERIVNANLDVWTPLQVDLNQACQIFADLDTGCTLGTNEFLFGIFKVRSLSERNEMWSIDYQQQRASHRLADIRNKVRSAVGNLHDRCINFSKLLQKLERQVKAIEAEIEEVQMLELYVMARRQEIENDEDERMAPFMLESNPEMREKEEALLAEMEALELRLKELEQAPDAAHRGPVAIAAVADDIVKSIRNTLQVDIEKEISAASEREHRLSRQAMHS